MADDKTFTKADVEAAVKAAVDKVQESIDKLEAKNSELLDEKKAAERKLRAASEIKPEDLTAAEERADKAEAALADANKQLKAATAEKDKAVKALETESGFTHKLLVENGLREQLVAAGVTHPAHQKGAIAMLAGQVQVSAEGDARVAKVGDKALADFVKEWSAGDEGKAFVTAPANSGGGSVGGRKVNGDAKTMTRSEYDALDQGAKATAGMQSAKGELNIVEG